MRNLVTGGILLLGVIGRYFVLQNQLPTTVILIAVAIFLIIIGAVELTIEFEDVKKPEDETK